MAVLYIRDKNGNKIPIYSIKGEKGDSYVLTEQDKKDIASLLGESSGVQGLSGEMAIDALPVGMSYAEGNVSLSYLIDAEMGVYESLDVETGSCIFKTVGRVADDSSGEMMDGAITVYVVPRNHILSHYDYGYSGTLFVTKISPRHDMYGMAYSVSTVSNEIVTTTTISPDMVDTGRVPTVGAVINYVSDRLSGGGSSGMTELNCWSGSIDDLARGGYYVVDGASIDYYDSNGEFASTSLANGAVVMVGERMDWNAESGRRKIAVVFEPDGYRYLG